MRILALFVVLLLAFLPTQAKAVDNAYDQFETMNSVQTKWFIRGALDMLVFDLATKNQRDRGQCAYDWYFDNDGLEDVLSAVDKNHRDPLSFILTDVVDIQCPQTP